MRYTRYREHSTMDPHMVKMIDYIEQLTSLESVMDNDLAINLIFLSFPNSYRAFITNNLMSDWLINDKILDLHC